MSRGYVYEYYITTLNDCIRMKMRVREPAGGAPMEKRRSGSMTRFFSLHSSTSWSLVIILCIFNFYPSSTTTTTTAGAAAAAAIVTSYFYFDDDFERGIAIGFAQGKETSLATHFGRKDRWDSRRLTFERSPTATCTPSNETNSSRCSTFTTPSPTRLPAISSSPTTSVTG